MTKWFVSIRSLGWYHPIICSNSWFSILHCSLLKWGTENVNLSRALNTHLINMTGFITTVCSRQVHSERNSVQRPASQLFIWSSLILFRRPWCHSWKCLLFTNAFKNMKTEYASYLKMLSCCIMDAFLPWVTLQILYK